MPQHEMFNNTPSIQSISQLIDEMMHMTDDPLADANANIVISRGNPEAKLMIVGEAPGPQENIKGKPFVGRAGQLLDKVLLAADFNPQEDVYITNSVFRMYPGEGGKVFRKPTIQEIELPSPLSLHPHPNNNFPTAAINFSISSPVLYA